MGDVEAAPPGEVKAKWCKWQSAPAWAPEAKISGDILTGFRYWQADK
jgi:hypothetical protein